MKRLTQTIKFNREKWKVQGLFPVDFVMFSCFPLAYFAFPEPAKKQNSVERVWNRKPKKQLDEEAARDHILEIGIEKPTVHREGFGGWYDLRKIKADKILYDILLAVIYALTFRLTPEQRMLSPQKMISREFAENFYFVSKLLRQEPYSMYTDISAEAPALYNPKRWDFNQFILAAGLERERVEQEKAMAQIKTGRR